MNPQEFKFWRTASEQEVAERAEISFRILNREAPKAMPAETVIDVIATEPNNEQAEDFIRRMDPRLLKYLVAIADHPDMPATKRDQLLGIDPTRGSRMRTRLWNEGLIEKASKATGTRGDNYIDVQLTELGRQVVAGLKRE